MAQRINPKEEIPLMPLESLQAISAELRRIEREEPQKLQTARQNTSTSIVISYQKADHTASMEILERNGLRPLTYKEALTILTEKPELKEQLKGKWFWIAGDIRNINDLFTGSESDAYFTFDNKGNLSKGKGNIEGTVHVWKGDDPFAFLVLAYDGASSVGRRFVFGALGRSDDVAPVVVGAPK